MAAKDTPACALAAAGGMGPRSKPVLEPSNCRRLHVMWKATHAQEVRAMFNTRQHQILSRQIPPAKVLESGNTSYASTDMQQPA
jgi:hypothetical protein